MATLAALILVLTPFGTDSRFAAGALGKIAYVQDGDIWMMALPSGQPQRLTTDGFNGAPSWSVSGEWLTFLRLPPIGASGFAGEVWAMRGDGTQRRLLASPGFWAYRQLQLVMASSARRRQRRDRNE
jgi:hypothetical protein